MKLVKVERWEFTGSAVPMMLARSSFADRYAAVRAAEQEGLICLANGSVVPDSHPATRVKSDDGLGTRQRSEGDK